MAEPEQTEGADAPRAPRSFSVRAERSLKDADRLLKKSPERDPQERAMLQLEQAKVFALLQLAEAIRDTQKR